MPVTQIFHQDYIKFLFWQISLTSFTKLSRNIVQTCGFLVDFPIYILHDYLCMSQTAFYSVLRNTGVATWCAQRRFHRLTNYFYFVIYCPLQILTMKIKILKILTQPGSALASLPAFEIEATLEAVFQLSKDNFIPTSI